MSINSFNWPRYTHAYKMMAEKAKYRPGAPFDRWGNTQLITDPDCFVIAAREYADDFAKEHDEKLFWIGCSSGSDLVSFIYTIEAARCICGQLNEAATRLLALALAERTTPTKFEDKI